MTVSLATPRPIEFCGEIHYFRLKRSEWASRLDDLLDAGCTTLATYIPWIAHELPDGTIDVTGSVRPELDLGAFLDLCAAKGCTVIARPGPFVMAELLNEGLPNRLFERFPDIVPVGWNGERSPGCVVDYLHPDFLAETRRWYAAVMPLLATRQASAGGPVVAVQLDNEIGMIPWITNAPDLSDRTVLELREWIIERHGTQAAATRYGNLLDAPERWCAGVRAPAEEIALELHADLGHYMQQRYARYVAELAAMARAEGVDDVPFLVNVHGTLGGTCAPFPLGISQLSHTWQDNEGVWPGTDVYIGDLTLGKLPGLWTSNAFTAATCTDQRWGTLEFEAGSGDYGETLDGGCGPTALGLKTWLTVGQGGTFLNYYLFAGGRNPRLFEPVGDGLDRIAFTGERHGFGAPISPEGQRTAGFYDIQAATTTVAGIDEWITRGHMATEVALGYVPDHFMTEYHYPTSERECAFVAELEQFRGSGSGEMMTKALLLAGFAPRGVDLSAARPLPEGVGCLAFAPTPYLAADVQRRVLDFVAAGGTVLMYGPLPVMDMEGKPCTTLIDGLGVIPGERMEQVPNKYYPTIAFPAGLFSHEVRVMRLQRMSAVEGVEHEVLTTEVGTGAPVGLSVAVGRGRAVLLASEVPYYEAFWSGVTDRLGVRPALRAHSTVPGVIVMPVTIGNGELDMIAHLGAHSTSAWFETANGQAAFDGAQVVLEPGDHVALARGLEVLGCRLVFATAGVLAFEAGHAMVRAGRSQTSVCLETAAQVDVPGSCAVRTVAVPSCSAGTAGIGREPGLRRIEITIPANAGDVRINWRCPL